MVIWWNLKVKSIFRKQDKELAVDPGLKNTEFVDSSVLGLLKLAPPDLIVGLSVHGLLGHPFQKVGRTQNIFKGLGKKGSGRENPLKNVSFVVSTCLWDGSITSKNN